MSTSAAHNSHQQFHISLSFLCSQTCFKGKHGRLLKHARWTHAGQKKYHLQRAQNHVKCCQLTALTSKALFLICTTSGNVTSGCAQGFPVTSKNGKGTKATGCKRKRGEGRTPCPREGAELPCKQSRHICELLIAWKYWMKCVEFMGNFCGVPCSYRGIPP